jgi:hypothetical protein
VKPTTLVFLLAAACDPRVFSDLADETWVESSGAPDGVDSGDYVFALAYADRSDATGTRFLAAGNGPGALGRISYSATGGRSASGRRITDLGVVIEDSSSFDPRKPIAGSGPGAAPDGAYAIGLPGESNLVGTTGMIMIVDGESFDIIRNVSGELGIEDLGGAVAWGNLDAGGVADLIATGITSVLVFPDATESPAAATVSCTVGRPLAARVLGAEVDGAAGDDVLVARTEAMPTASSTASDIAITSLANIAAAQAAADGGRCFDAPRAPIATLASPNGEGDFGLRLAAGNLDGNAKSDVVVASPDGETVYAFLDVEDLIAAQTGPITDALALAAPAGAAGFGTSISVGDLDGDGSDELAVGAPGTSPGGAVYVFALSGAGTAFELVNTLHDIEPEGGQEFGRDVLIAPFGSGGQGVLAVATSGELFTYFRVAAGFSDVRQ